MLDECCVACLNDNKSSFSSVNENVDEFEEFLGEKLPPVFTNFPVILCNGCSFQLEKFRNFKQTVQTSINTLTRQLNKVYGCRVFVEPLEMIVESLSNVVKIEQPEIEICNVYEPLEDDKGENEFQDAETESDTDSNAPLKLNGRKASRRSMSPEIMKEQENEQLKEINGQYRIIRPRKARETVDLYCSLCKRTVKSITEHCKSVHMIHLEDDFYQCKICKREFRSESNGGLYNHINIHREFLEPQKCGECGEIFTIIGEWRNHLRKHSVSFYQCLTCHERFETVPNLYSHVTKEHGCSKKRTADTSMGSRSKRKKTERSIEEEEDGVEPIEDTQSSLGLDPDAMHATLVKSETALEVDGDFGNSFDQWDADYLEQEPVLERNDNENQENEEKIDYEVEREGGRTRVFTKSKGKTLKWHQYLRKFKHKLPARKLEGKKRSFTGLDVDCTVCGLKKLSRNYRSHVLSVHAIIQEGKYFCAECNMECSSNQSLVYHFDGHRKLLPPKKCPEEGCDESMDNMKDYKRHTEAHRYKKEFKCPECDNEYFRVTSLQFHYIVIHTKAMMCRFCQLVFELKEDYDLHMKAENLVRKEKKRLVRYTKIRLALEKEKEEKLKQGIEVEETPEENANIDTITDLPMVFCRPITKVNVKKAEKFTIPKFTKLSQPIYCHVCQINTTNFKNHVTEVHATKLDAGGYSCNICHSCLKDNYYMHFYQMHREFPSVQKCSECDFSSIKCEPMRKHMWIHKRGLFKCHYCGSSYTEKTSLRYHMFFKHTDLFICCYCNKTYEEESVYKQHMIEEKEKRKKVKKSNMCDICGFTTIHAAYMKGHMTRVHSDTRTDSVICNICGKKCKSVLNLKDHIRNVHGTKNEVCVQCGKRFRNQAYLREHIKNAHSTEISKCQMCDKVGTPIQLKRHVYMCHDATRPWVCKICNMTFKLKTGLQKHLHTHAGTRPFNCHLCTQGFYNREVLQKHFIDLHKLNLTREEIRQISQRLPSIYEKKHMGGESDSNE